MSNGLRTLAKGFSKFGGELGLIGVGTAAITALVIEIEKTNQAFATADKSEQSYLNHKKLLVKTTYESSLAKAREGKEVRNLDNLVRTGLITAVQRKKIEAEYAKATADGTIILKKQSQVRANLTQKW